MLRSLVGSEMCIRDRLNNTEIIVTRSPMFSFPIPRDPFQAHMHWPTKTEQHQHRMGRQLGRQHHCGMPSRRPRLWQQYNNNNTTRSSSPLVDGNHPMRHPISCRECPNSGQQPCTDVGNSSRVSLSHPHTIILVARRDVLPKISSIIRASVSRQHVFCPSCSSPIQATRFSSYWAISHAALELELDLSHQVTELPDPALSVEQVLLQPLQVLLRNEQILPEPTYLTAGR
eukprot:TRINITY_DN4698_c0_g1_i5.p1 TRINITY_DN4698_c0_g1~~TRINITY_DN4698_c0_g1_i5.p1  ORF type:complete len:230 (-),score=42.30 TRINITY_DN4698_c0_g1_i5:85-774(-)